jgi:hypothetical protein
MASRPWPPTGLRGTETGGNDPCAVHLQHASRIPGITTMSWLTIVVIRNVCSFLPGLLREQKKLAARIPALSHIFAMVCAIAVFPAPAGPFIHKTWGCRPEAVTQVMISSTTATLVFSWHFGASPRSAELCSAPATTCFWSSFKPNAGSLQESQGIAEET